LPISPFEVSAASKNLTKVRQWLEQAGASGDHVAAFNLGVCLEGIGMERDETSRPVDAPEPPKAS